MGSELRESTDLDVWMLDVIIPHGGLRTPYKSRVVDSQFGQVVTIPHGGLRTKSVFEVYKWERESPSHPVGSELLS